VGGFFLSFFRLISFLFFLFLDTLIVIDSLNDLAEFVGGAAWLPAFLSSLSSALPVPGARGRTALLVGTFHTDVVAAPPSSYASPYASPYAPYAPSALALLRYLATAILTAHCLPHELQRKRARDRALAEPAFGAGGERVEGVLVGLSANGAGGVLVEMELRRKSGRGVRECFVLLLSAAAAAAGMAEGFVRLDDYPPYHESEDVALLAAGEEEDGRGGKKDAKNKGKDKGKDDGDGGMETTFSLALSQKQRQDREGVVLPYFDAQRWEGGVGEGGRILYQMGAEDDFDDEDDEI
jgi:elongator complex protein 5